MIPDYCAPSFDSSFMSSPDVPKILIYLEVLASAEILIGLSWLIMSLP